MVIFQYWSINHQSDLPSLTVVDLVRTVFAVLGVCNMIRHFLRETAESDSEINSWCFALKKECAQ